MLITTTTTPLKSETHVCKTSAGITIIQTEKPAITMHRGECSVYGCYCKEYVGANVGTCENCGHHYDSHRY